MFSRNFEPLGIQCLDPSPPGGSTHDPERSMNGKGAITKGGELMLGASPKSCGTQDGILRIDLNRDSLNVFCEHLRIKLRSHDRNIVPPSRKKIGALDHNSFHAASPVACGKREIGLQRCALPRLSRFNSTKLAINAKSMMPSKRLKCDRA